MATTGKFKKIDYEEGLFEGRLQLTA